MCALFVTTSFSNWTIQYNKTYNGVMEQYYRESIFNENVRKINEHNADERYTYSLGLNQFADLTATEFKQQYVTGGYNRPYPRYANYIQVHTAVPTSVDWTEKGAVTPVKTQGECAACWAFSITGSIEGAHFLKNGSLISLSEQQLIDCSGPEGNQGCQNGVIHNGFQYIIDNKGITSEAAYPYTATDGTCKKNQKAYATITSFVDVIPKSDQALMAAIAQQPVSVAVEADPNSFHLYSGGVMTAACGTNLDHAVLAVGYGSDAGQDYYKVKNSWGDTWGEAGYICLGRGYSYNDGAGQCGILMEPSYPISSGSLHTPPFFLIFLVCLTHLYIVDTNIDFIEVTRLGFKIIVFFIFTRMCLPFSLRTLHERS